MVYDFGGYVTVNDLLCADGRTIRKNAFKDCDGLTVPMVWQHRRDEPSNVLGHMLLENREDGVYGYGKFNETEKAITAKALVEHGDIRSLSIYANQLQQNGKNVVHGVIREVSLVLAGANPGAYIDNLEISHSDGTYDVIDEEAVIYCDGEMEHSQIEVEEIQNGSEDVDTIDIDDEVEHAEGEATVKEIFDSLNPEQKSLFYAMVGSALAEAKGSDDSAEHSDEGGNEEMRKNAFDQSMDSADTKTLSHGDIKSIFENAKKIGSLKQAVSDYALEHSIVGVGDDSNKFPEDVLFPDPKLVGENPEMIMRPQEWVTQVWNATRKSPFSRIKSIAADITADEARAKGYIKGKKKQEEVIAMLKRVTTPQTVYKLQKLDRDDIIDITDFNVVSWIKNEMRVMLNEELARAVLVGDGRTPGAEDKINDANIRPIWTDDDLYTIKYPLKIEEGMSDDEKADAFVTAVHRSRKNYMGSGSPILYTDTDTLTTLLLAKDKIGRRLYNTTAELASALRVSGIVEVPVMEGLTREARVGVDAETGKQYTLMGLIVNLSDYTVGADRGGAVSMFDDFDIDYNRYTYLIETRCSGALRRPYSAIAIEMESAKN